MRWALAGRSISKPDEIAYYLAYMPPQVTVQELVRVAGGRSRSASRPRERMRPGPVRSPPLPGLVAAHRSGHARARLPGRHGTPVLGKAAGQMGQPRRSGSQWRRFGHSWQLVAPGPAPERTLRTTPRTELVELAPPTPSSRPPLPLPAALSHDRGAVSVRPPPHDRSPATLPPPGERPGQTVTSCWKTGAAASGHHEHSFPRRGDARRHQLRVLRWSMCCITAATMKHRGPVTRAASDRGSL